MKAIKIKVADETGYPGSITYIAPDKVVAIIVTPAAPVAGQPQSAKLYTISGNVFDSKWPLDVVDIL